MLNFDYKNPVEVFEGIFWTGYHNKKDRSHSNSYLIIDEDEAVFIDPGSISHFPEVMRKVMDLIDPIKISTLIAQHQDPDVCGNLMIVEDIIKNNELRIAAHINTIRLIKGYDIQSNFYAVEQNNYCLELNRGGK